MNEIVQNSSAGEQQSKHPSLRFYGFTEEWKVRKLGEVAKFNPKEELPYEFEYVDLESVVGTEMLSHRTETKDSAPSRAQRLAHTGDLFYQTVRPYQRNNYLFEKSFNNYVFSTGYAQIRPFVDSYFLLCLVQCERFIKIVLDNCTGTSYPTINAKDLANIEISYPTSLPEQSRIGTFFKTLDDLITLRTRKLEKLRNVKKAFLGKMFVGKNNSASEQECYSAEAQNHRSTDNRPAIRFNGFDGEWEVRKLGEVGKIVTGSTPSTACEEYYSDNGIPWVTPTDISENIIYNTPRKLSQKGQKVGRVVPKDTILVTCIASIGKNTMLGTEGSFNQQINGIVPNFDKYNSYFLFTESAIWSETMKRQAAAGTMQIVNKTEFSELITILPSLPEQSRIGAFFKTLDNLIALQEKELTKLKNIKQACLQRMFI